MEPLTAKISEEALEELTRCLVAEFDPERIILFGSQAWGEPNKDSDVDLCVIVSESDEREHLRMARAHHCTAGIHFPKDILVKTRAQLDRYKDVPGSFGYQILTEGRVLYERREE
jgi:predicted nucleotidyltransferase